MQKKNIKDACEMVKKSNIPAIKVPEERENRTEQL